MKKIMGVIFSLFLVIQAIEPVHALYNNSSAMSCAIELIDAAVHAYNTNVNIKECRLSKSEMTSYFWQATAGTTFRDIIDGFTMKYSSTYVDSISLKYRYNRTSTITLLDSFEKKADNLIQSLDLKMSTLDKLFYLHNYLALHTEYDEEAATYQLESSMTHIDSTYALSFSTIGPLLNGKAVCSGYSQNYLYLLSKLGIEAKYVTSASMNHGWNLVNYNGNWYHIDVTYDDPVPDIKGYVDYKYFMANDEEIASDHTWEDSSIQSNSKAFTSENYIFNQNIKDAYYYDGYWYYVKNHQICRSTIDSIDFEIIHEDNNVMDIYLNGDTIYYTTSSNYYYLDTINERDIANTYDVELTSLKPNTYVEGLYYEKNELFLTTKEGEENYFEINLEASFESYIDSLAFHEDAIIGGISAYLNYHSALSSIDVPLKLLLTSDAIEYTYELEKMSPSFYTFTIPFEELVNGTYTLKILKDNIVYDFIEYYPTTLEIETLQGLSIQYQDGVLEVSGGNEYEEEKPFDYSKYGNGLFPIYENSRVTYMNMYDDHTLHICGYAFEKFNSYKRPNSFVRELVFIEMTTNKEYRIPLDAIYNPYLNKNKNLNPDGSYDYSYAFYDTTVDFNHLYSYWDKEEVSLEKGTYRLFIRLSDGKRSNVISLQNLKEDVSLPNNYFIIENSNDVGFNYGV